MSLRILQGTLWTLACCFMLLAGPVSACIFRVWVFQDVFRLGYALSVAETGSNQLQDAVQALEVELASLTSPAYLESMAKSYGLRPAAAAERIADHDSALAMQWTGHKAGHGTP